mgnify:CR=1 FL=1|jgi:spermidine synthase
MRKYESSLVFFAAASLYLELALIRFAAAEVLYLGYFSNFILISAFVGLGLGFLSLQKNIRVYKYIPFLLLFIFALILTAQFDVDLLRNRFGLFFFGNITKQPGLPAALLLFLLFLSTVIFFTGIGNRIADNFTRFNPLKAYTLDIAGSLAGILLFSLQCYFSSDPVIWILTGVLLMVLGFLYADGACSRSMVGGILVSGFCVIILLLSSSTGGIKTWSMYQKLELKENPAWSNKVLFANGIIHQILAPSDKADANFYSIPYRLKQQHDGRLNDILVVGAGTGTDVAVALRYDVGTIDAVEIDREIVNLGIQHHPDAPYQDPRVNIIVNDGRQFLRNTTKQYDLIIFALPDSLMRLSAFSSVRLESYLFTLEALADVKARLRDSGMFVMYNQYRWPWLVNKLMTALEETFGMAPLRIEADDQVTTLLAVADGLGGSEYSREGFSRLATDDWPFVYMKEPGVHWLYIGMIAMFVIFAFLGVYFLSPRGFISRPNLPYFFMGAAFLLLETKSLAFFSLLFGTTWFVNTIAFSGILLSVMVANLVVWKSGIRNRKPLFILLFSSLLVMYLVPNSFFLNIESGMARYLVAIMFAFAPIFFANLVFSREFRDSEESTNAFGWNLLGAVVGGGLEYLSLYLGFNNLLLIVALLYVCTAITIRRLQPS